MPPLPRQARGSKLLRLALMMVLVAHQITSGDGAASDMSSSHDAHPNAATGDIPALVQQLSSGSPAQLQQQAGCGLT
ncbi:hypothetical protein FOA52_008908 [Chlamydomonas sp. UWO 241]|nr:hypothetical protein FOA52_008908 [Chlamydomonas sp. UWO 241]